MPALDAVPTRRGLVAAAALGLVLASSRLRAEPAPTPRRIVSLDYGLAETLLALGVTPLAIAEADQWATWVVEPPMPPDVVNLGAAQEANLELLSVLKPDLILSTPYLDALRPTLQRIARTEIFAINTPEPGTPYVRSVDATRRLGGLIGRAGEAQALIAASAAQMAATRAALAPQAGPPVFLVSFMDTRHVRVYGAKSLFDDVLTLCGLTNAWQGHANYWGFATVGIEQLARAPEARLIYVEPIAADVRAALARSPLWNSLGFVRAGRVHAMPPVLMFGMLPSAMRFARLLQNTLAGDERI
ncbi:ABC transporter substrate-binding protein [Ancylobacter sp. IITR112]|uniref:ABC transporter substrate-binding protein n=1 Tax=Ancylobacter sp. IITR112 TaxID=3138073 RepID=UPI00352A2D1A